MLLRKRFHAQALHALLPTRIPTANRNPRTQKRRLLARAQAIFTGLRGDWNTARAGSFRVDFLMSSKIPERIEGFIQFLLVDEDAEDNKLCVQHLMVDHRQHGHQEEVDEVLWRILRCAGMAVGCHKCYDANDALSSEPKYT